MRLDCGVRVWLHDITVFRYVATVSVVYREGVLLPYYTQGSIHRVAYIAPRAGGFNATIVSLRFEG